MRRLSLLDAISSAAPCSLVLRHSLWWWSIPWASAAMSVLSTMHHHRRRLLSTSALQLLLNVRSVFDVLSKMANMASDLLVRLERERDDGDEAECEPLPALHYLK